MTTLKERINEYLASQSSGAIDLGEVEEPDFELDAYELDAYEEDRDRLDRKNEQESLEHIKMMLHK